MPTPRVDPPSSPEACGRMHGLGGGTVCLDMPHSRSGAHFISMIDARRSFRMMESQLCDLNGVSVPVSVGYIRTRGTRRAPRPPRRTTSNQPGRGMTGVYCKPLQIGSLRLENNLFAAPLAGYSSAPFRALTWRLGRPGLAGTEMISAQALLIGSPGQEPYLARAEAEGPVQFQLWGCREEAITAATRIVTQHGADVVDLNCGCPVRKVRAAGAGSKLMEDPPLIARLVRCMREATDRPVTVKIRVGTGPENYNGVEVAQGAAEAGADAIIVHGRHARERYATPVRYERIREVVEAVGVPVIGNGDVRDGESARRMFEETGCAGVMVGRACMGAPWVFARIRAELTGEPYRFPTFRAMGETLLEHYDLLAGLIGADRAIRQVRKLGSFYSRGVHGAKEFRNRMNGCSSRTDLVALVQLFFFEGHAMAMPSAVSEPYPFQGNQGEEQS